MENLKVCVGVDLEGNEVYLNLDRNILITGACGRGKTNIVYNIIDGLEDVDNVEIDVIDLKGIEYNLFNSDKVKVFNKIEIIHSLMDDVLKEIDNRSSLCRYTKCTSINNYNDLKRVQKLPSLIVVVEELGWLSNDRKFMNKLNLIVSLGRAFNITTIVLSQIDRVDFKIMANALSTIELPTLFNKYATAKLGITDSMVYKIGNGILINDGIGKVVKFPLNKRLRG